MLIEQLQFDEWNEAEFGRHGVTMREILQVFDGDPVFFPNKKKHRSPVLMVGPTWGGRMLTVPLAETEPSGVWRPATAWDSDADEILRYMSVRRS